jgi:hypothetical protein
VGDLLLLSARFRLVEIQVANDSAWALETVSLVDERGRWQEDFLLLVRVRVCWSAPKQRKTFVLRPKQTKTIHIFQTQSKVNNQF